MWQLFSKLVRSTACGSQTVTPSDTDANTTIDDQERSNEKSEVAFKENETKETENIQVDEQINIVRGQYKKFFIEPVRDLVIAKEIKLDSNLDPEPISDSIFNSRFIDEDNNVVHISRFTVIPVKSKETFTDICLNDTCETNKINIVNTLEDDTLLFANKTQSLEFISYSSSSSDIGKNPKEVEGNYSELSGNKQSRNFNKNERPSKYMHQCDEDELEANLPEKLPDESSKQIKSDDKVVEVERPINVLENIENTNKLNANISDNQDIIRNDNIIEKEIQRSNFLLENTDTQIANATDNTSKSRSYQNTPFSEDSSNYYFQSKSEIDKTTHELEISANNSVKTVTASESKEELCKTIDYQPGEINSSKVDQLTNQDLSLSSDVNTQVNPNYSTGDDINKEGAESVSSKNTYRDILDRYNPLGDKSDTSIKFTYEYTYPRPKYKMLKRRASKRFVLSESGEEPTWGNEKSTDPKTVTQDATTTATATANLTANASNNIK